MLDRRIDLGAARKQRAILDGLTPRTTYAYRIVVTRRLRISQRASRIRYDIQLYRAPISESPDVDAETIDTARQIINAADARIGYCVVAGEASYELAFELARQSELNVTLLETAPQQIARARSWLLTEEAYGSRVTVLPVDAYDKLPLRENFANLVVLDSGNVELDGLLRILRPGSRAVFTRNGQATLDSASIDTQPAGPLAIFDKPRLTGTGEWTHQYGGPENRSSCGETLAGADRTGELDIQWLGRPGGDFGLDRNPRMPAPLSSEGRLFHQGMNRIVALDAYNGAALWNLEIPALRRVNIPRDCGNWCLGDNQLYCVVRNQLWQIDPQSGRIAKCIQLPEDTRAEHTWGYVAHDGHRVIGSSVHRGGVYTEFWGKAQWYDKQVPHGTSMVCSDSVFAYEPGKVSPAWLYRGGAIVNPTITVDHGRIYFAESRGEHEQAANPRRSAGKALWKDLFLVALDASTGRKIWEQPLATVPAEVVFFGLSDPDGIVLATSADNLYRIDRFSPQDGAPLWHAEHKWTSNNHSGHMQHPVIVGDAIFLEPKGYQLKDGTEIETLMGRHEGCHTYLASSNALIYRGKGRKVSMWSLEDGDVTSWTSLRPSCWLSVIPANGMLLVPEGGGGCSCGRWLETSIGFAPWATANDWTGTSGEKR